MLDLLVSDDGAGPCDLGIIDLQALDRDPALIPRGCNGREPLWID